MDRREMLKSVAAMAAALTAGRALADDGMAGMDHEHMDMGEMHHHHHHAANPHQKLLEATADCILKAQLCVNHCLVSMGRGETDLADCARSANEVIAMCSALQAMAAADSRHLADLAKVTMDVCKDCQDECKKTEKHPECKACGEACAACVKECKALLG